MHDETLYDEKFVKRMTQLRMEKGVSARDMSLSIGQRHFRLWLISSIYVNIWISLP